MEEKEQIEEMEKVLNECCNVYDEQGNHIRNKCSECDCWSDDNHCCCSYNSKEATALYNADYRKQVQGNWLEVRIVRYNGRKAYTQFVQQCSNCRWLNKHSKDCNTNYCPYCGAYMKGAE